MAPVTENRAAPVPPGNASPAPPGSRRLRLGLLLYPFVAAAVAVNLFMLGLLAPIVGMAPLSPWAALLAAVPLGLPATWLAARWVGGLIAEAEGEDRR